MCHRCSAGEEKLNLPEGVLKKTLKSKEQKERELEEVVNFYTFNWDHNIMQFIDDQGRWIC